MSTTPGGRRFLEHARRLPYGAPTPPAAPAASIAADPPVPRDFRGWPGQVDFPDLTPEEVAARYLNGGSPHREDHETKRLVRAWLEARNAAPERERKRKSK